MFGKVAPLHVANQKSGPMTKSHDVNVTPNHILKAVTSTRELTFSVYERCGRKLNKIQNDSWSFSGIKMEFSHRGWAISWSCVAQPW